MPPVTPKVTFLMLNLTEQIQVVTDIRGQLHVVQTNQLSRPFRPQRVFWITQVPKDTIRGEHANKACTELLVAVHGSFRVWLTDGHDSCEVLLDHPGKGLYIPPMVWCRLWDFSADSVALCMADLDYDKSLYINDYEEFLQAVKS